MKKLFALLLLPSIAFAGKIGENYVGVELGSSSIGFAYSDNDPTSVAIDSSGFSWEISANYNIYKPNAGKYGADLYLSYFNTSSDDSAKDNSNQTWIVDTELSVFALLVRPHYDFGGVKVFADLGLFHQDIKSLVNTTNITGDSTEFLYGVGFEVTSGSLSSTPSISWTESPSLKVGDSTYTGNDTTTYSIPVSYAYSESIDITLSFSAIDNDDFTALADTDQAKVKTEITTIWGIGIDYKF